MANPLEMASNDMVEASAPRSLRKKQYGCKIDRQQRRPHLPPAIAQRRIPLYWRLILIGAQIFLTNFTDAPFSLRGK
jgi:hypothetical protein